MFHGVVLSGWFDGEAVPPDIDLAHERFDLSTESFSMHFDPGFPCEFASSVTLTVPIEHPSPSADVFVVSPCGTWTEPKADTFFPAGKASLSVVDDAASGATTRGGELVAGRPGQLSLRTTPTRIADELAQTPEGRLAARLQVRVGPDTVKVRVPVEGKMPEIDVFRPGRIVGETTDSPNALLNPSNFLSNPQREAIRLRMVLARETRSTAVFEFTQGVSDDVVWYIRFQAERYGVPWWVYAG